MFGEALANDIPTGWTHEPLGEVADVTAGGDRPDIFSEVRTPECNVPIFSNGTENFGLYGFTNEARIMKESVTVSARGTIGYVCLREEPYVPIVRLISVQPKDTRVSAKYLYFLLNSSAVHSTGTSQQQITVPDFKQKSILVPDIASAAHFTELVNPIFCKIRENIAEMDKLQMLQENLLTKLSSR